MQKFRQSSIVFEKPGIQSENLKTLTSSNYPTVQYFLLKLRTRFLLTNVYKRVCGVLIDLELFAKIKLDLVSTHSILHTRLITQVLNKIKKIPHTLLQTLLSKKRAQNFSKKVLNSMLVGAGQSVQFFRQKTWFLGKNRGLP